MANEVSLTFSLGAYKALAMSSAIGRSRTGLLFTMNGLTYIEGTLSILTSATLIPLGGVTAPHWAFFANLDATNFIRLRNGAAGADLGRLYPGEACPFPLDNACAPYAIADTAACYLEYLILQY